MPCGPRQPQQESVDMSGTRGLLSRSALRPQSHKEDRCGAIRRIFPYDGKATQEPRVVTKKSTLNLGGKNETDEGSTVRCQSKEPANPHNPNTTHTPITYAGHNTSKHARNPVRNGANERIKWRHGRTARRETSFQNEGQTENCFSSLAAIRATRHRCRRHTHRWMAVTSAPLASAFAPSLARPTGERGPGRPAWPRGRGD